MNYLGHLYLSGNNEKILVGNFIGDYVKGKQYLNFSPEIQKGILLHRAIDHFTDQNNHWKSTRVKIYPLYKRYAGVVADLFFDHFLAINWEHYHNESLPVYATKVHKILWNNFIVLPVRVQGFLPFLIQHRRLVSYSTFTGIEESLRIMSNRRSLPEHSSEAIDLLESHYALFESDFTAFMNEILFLQEADKNFNALLR